MSLSLENRAVASYHPCYDINKSYEGNAEEGPVYFEKPPKRLFASREKWGKLFGFPIASPIGVPAGPLLNSKWTTFAARLGFDIVTYKTIRSYAWPAHEFPNVVMVSVPSGAGPDSVAIRVDSPPSQIAELAITNSFGNPSRAPEYLQQDIAAARAALVEGQLLIVSVFGTGESAKEVSQDYIRAALLAKDAGAQLVEANLSCPNLKGKRGCSYLDLEMTKKVVRELATALGAIPLTVKVGTFDSDRRLTQTLRLLAQAGARGICGINTIRMRAETKDGRPALGPGREMAGICGGPIRSVALRFVSSARQIIDRDGLGLTLMGCGGITGNSDIQDFLDAGAEATLTATCMMWNPHLAIRWHQSQENN